MMLSVVESDNSRYEGLRDYITGNKRPPPFVSAPNSNPRLATKPGDPVPGVTGRIPVSSQRPGKRTNETVPYARIVFTDFPDSPADPSDILPGDIVMLHKTSNSLGHDSNRASKCATWRQINSVLLRDFGVVGSTGLGKGMEKAIIAARKQFLMGMEEAVQIDIDEAAFLAQRRIPQSLDFRTHSAYLPFLIPVLKNEILKAENNDPTAVLLPVYDLFSLSFFKDWTPDGILMSRDDDEQSASYFHAGGGDSGVALNVAIQGPAYARNSKGTQDLDKNVQMFDPEPRIRDAVYLLVICYYSTNDAGDFLNYGFQLKPTSARIIEALVQIGDGTSDPDREYPVEGGLTWNELKYCAFAWQIGTVMDNNAAGKTRPQLQLNVSISPLPFYKMWALFGNKIGSFLLTGAQPMF